MKKVYIIIFTILVLIIILVIGINKNKTRPFDQPLSGAITIDDKDRDCTSDEDCVVVSIRCGDCGYDAINKTYVDKYKYNLEQACRGYEYACDTDYRPTHEIKCVDRKCRLVLKKISQH